MSTSTGDGGAPYTVALVAMGPSHKDYLDQCITGMGRQAVADETWVVNAMAGVIQHDRAFIMDDLPYFAKAAREINPSLKGYAAWLGKHPGPIYAQKAYKDFPGAVPYPLEEVLNSIGYPYLNNTVCYAVAFAIHLKVKTLKLFGIDYTSDQNRGFSEAGRACCEYLLAVAVSRGMKVEIAPTSTLCDQSLGRKLYGYSVAPKVTQVEGKWKVEF